MVKRAHAQGSVDGLCGIYCLVSFLDRAPRLSKLGRTKAHAAFAELLKDAERLDLLSARQISQGYHTNELVAIFNATAARKRLPFIAHELRDITDIWEGLSATTILKQLFDEEAAAIVSVHGGEHWVLANSLGPDDQIVVKDPGHREEHRKHELKRVTSGIDGVALLHRRSAAARAIR